MPKAFLRPETAAADEHGDEDREEVLPHVLGYEPIAFSPPAPSRAPVEGEGEGDEDGSNGHEPAPAGMPGAFPHGKHHQSKKKHPHRGGHGRRPIPTNKPIPARRAALGGGAGRSAARTAGNDGGNGGRAAISAAHRRQAKMILFLGMGGLFLICLAVASYRVPWMLHQRMMWPWNILTEKEWFPVQILPKSHHRAIAAANCVDESGDGEDNGETPGAGDEPAAPGDKSAEGGAGENTGGGAAALGRQKVDPLGSFEFND